jgi:hypothetical protein
MVAQRILQATFRSDWGLTPMGGAAQTLFTQGFGPLTLRAEDMCVHMDVPTHKEVHG